jgi:deoxyribose-phosphate aldolase
LLENNIDYIKTSTGFGPKGAEVNDIKLFKSILGNKVQIKASGGIRDYNTALAMLRAGASRIGASASVKIVDGQI